MSSVSSVSSFQSSTASSKAQLTTDYDTFLQLLTTQLQNQNPLDPLDTNQFTEQLVQFSQVEQQIKSNEMLTALLESSQQSNAASAGSYLGATVSAEGDIATFSNGKAEWSWNADRAAETATITIENSNGETLWQQTQALEAGESSIKWDGRTLNGGYVTSGEYKIKIDAKDATGRTVPISTEVVGTVDQVNVSGGDISLQVGNLEIPLNRVTSLRKGS